MSWALLVVAIVTLESLERIVCKPSLHDSLLSRDVALGKTTITVQGKMTSFDQLASDTGGEFTRT